MTSMCVYRQVCAFMYMCVCVHVLHVCACVRMCVHACMHACVRVCMCVCVPACVPACMRACLCMHVCMCACVCASVDMDEWKHDDDAVIHTFFFPFFFVCLLIFHLLCNFAHCDIYLGCLFVTAFMWEGWGVGGYVQDDTKIPLNGMTKVFCILYLPA